MINLPKKVCKWQQTDFSKSFTHNMAAKLLA